MPPSRSGIVTLTTDFGRDDSYVAQLHAVLLGINPGLPIVDVSHAVPPGDLRAALYLTETAWPHFPAGTVHLVVVDPGVGTERGVVAVQSERAFLVGPDTGVLSSGLPARLRPAAEPVRVPLAPPLAAVDVRGGTLSVSSISQTFHGRDLMAPVAAALATGRGLDDCGEPAPGIVLAPSLATALRDGEGAGVVLHVDRFGNAITSFRSAETPAQFLIEAGGREVAGPAPHYQPAPGVEAEAIALPSSGGYLEIAWPNGSAAERLGLARGTALHLRAAGE